MNALDVIVAVAAVSAAVGGYREGFTRRVLSWLGLGLGLFAAVRSLPWVFSHIDVTIQTRVMFVTILVTILGGWGGQRLGLAVGSRLTPRDPARADAAVDRAMGAVAGLVGLVVMAWLVLPVAAVTPGWPADLAGGSLVAQALRSHLPEPPNATRALEALVGRDNFPRVFDAFQATQPVGAPPAGSGISAATSARVAASILKVEGLACSRVQDGTGFVVAPDLVVTNAHVVAGESTTTVIRDDGSRLRATVVAFDPDRDLSLLHAPGLARPALGISKASRGSVGGVFGHPGGEPLRVAAFRVSRLVDARGRDIYGIKPTDRSVLELAARLRPGDSGSPLVDPAGQVIGVAFAISTDSPGVAYGLATTELDAVLASRHDVAVGVGPCTG